MPRRDPRAAAPRFARFVVYAPADVIDRLLTEIATRDVHDHGFTRGSAEMLRLGLVHGLSQLAKAPEAKGNGRARKGSPR